jgi:hypothetical protein
MSKSLKTKDLVLIGILLAAGAIIKLFIPKLPVTPNTIISMYALAILLVRPTLLQTLGIGLVSAILSQMITAAPVPFINFIGEPAGAVVCYFLCKIPFGRGFTGNFVKPAVVTFITTLVSGGIFVAVLSLVLLSRGGAAKWALFNIVVIPTAVANMIITTVCYAPLKRVLKIND